MNRPETIEETAALVDEAGGRGIAVRVDHLVPDEVRALVARIEDEQGALHVLANDIWGATKMEWSKTVWESDLDYGLRTLRLGVDTHAITSHFAVPLLLKTPGGLVVEVTDGTDEYNATHYRVSFFYDLAKAAVNRMAFALAHELKPHAAPAIADVLGVQLAVAPGLGDGGSRLRRVLASGRWRAACRVPARTRRPIPLLFVAALSAAPGILFAQGGIPLGPEFRINTYTTGHQSFPAVASDSAGNFVVVWHGRDAGYNDYGIYAQRYASTGAPLGGEFRVNSYTTQQQRYPSVASDSAGNFVVVWQSLFQNSNDYGVFAQRYASSGAPLGPEFRVNTYTLANKFFARVASDPAGNFVVVWQSFFQEGTNFGIYAQRYSATGAPLGGEFRVNTYTTDYQGSASVASDSAGNFVVVWLSLGQDGSGAGVFAQRYASTGTPLGGEFRVNTFTPNHQALPAVASDAAGNFVVAWESTPNQDGNGPGVFAQRYSSSGIPLGGEFRVNTYTAYEQNYPSVATDPAGNFVVVWQSYQDGIGYGVFGQRYASTGLPLGGEFRVNSYTFHHQRYPAVAANSAGAFVVVWDSYSEDGAAGGIFGQRYNMIVPVELLDFTVE
jgi:NAD(P)-dependent dehydrogenase (short-subunit alcohol dehydrogenase family)